MKLRVLDLFSGIGGFSLGLDRAGGFETVAFCEIDPFCRDVIAKHWPDVLCWDDVRTLNAHYLREAGIDRIDVITGGFPCQDISSAGTRAGLDGERSGLWREYDRLVCELRPRFVVVENSSDLLARGFGDVLGDLASSGYHAVWDCIPAAAVGAEILRDRAYILAVSDEVDGFAGLDFHARLARSVRSARDRLRSEFRSEPSSPAVRADAGVSKGLDRAARRGALGNTVVPQIPELIGRAILSTLKEAA